MTSGHGIANELLKNADVILDELTAAEAGEHEVCASHTVEMKGIFERDDFLVSANTTGAEYGVRSIVDGRMGFVTTNSDRTGDLREAAREVRTVRALALPSEHHHVVTGNGPLGHEEHCDPALLTPTAADLHELLGHLVTESTSDPRIAMERAELTWTVRTNVLANSAGVRGSCARTFCSWMVMGMARSGDEITSFDYDGSSVARRDGLEDAIARSGAAFRESVLGSLGAERGESYKGKVLLHPDQVLSLLGETVTANCNGLWHVDGISAWTDRVGERVASDLLSVTEDPHDRALAGWTPFDREGTPTSHHALIDRGELRFIAHSGFSAHRAGTEPTGNSVGGARNLPRIGFRNLSVEVPDGDDRVMSEEALVRTLENGLVLKRFSGNSDPQSGHFSGTAKNSWWVRDGERAQAVNEVMVSGNLFELLESVVAGGDTPHTLFGQARAPYVLVDGVSVTAG